MRHAPGFHNAAQVINQFTPDASGLREEDGTTPITKADGPSVRQLLKYTDGKDPIQARHLILIQRYLRHYEEKHQDPAVLAQQIAEREAQAQAAANDRAQLAEQNAVLIVHIVVGVDAFAEEQVHVLWLVTTSHRVDKLV
eukprot:COSAG05_NODE_67_length_22197_cov_42.906417_1_plen_139_part_10